MNAHLKASDAAFRAFTAAHAEAHAIITEDIVNGRDASSAQSPRASAYAKRVVSLSTLGQSFSDDKSANDWLAYNRDHRRVLSGIIFTPAEAWECFVFPDVGVTPAQFLATGGSLSALVALLPVRELLTDYGRATLSLILQVAITETVDAVLATPRSVR